MATSGNQAIRTSRQACPSRHGWPNKAARALWGIAWFFLFRPSPVPFRAWRRFLLRCFGARIGAGAKVMPSVRIWAPWNLTVDEEGAIGDFADCYCVAPIHVGAHATVSQYAHLCAASHDICDANMRLIADAITIGDGAWVCAGAFVGMGVTVGEGAVCGAHAVVVRDVPPWVVVAGNPARPIKKRELRS